MSNQDQVSRERGNLLANGTVTELEELLKTAAQDIPLDETYLDALEAAILQRETECPTGRLSDPDKAWERFQKRRSLENRAAHDADTLKAAIFTEHRRKPHHLRRTLLIAAVIIIMMVLLLPPVLGFRDIFQMVAQWTSEQFQFVTPTHENSDQKATMSVIENLREYGFPTSFAPTWIPGNRKLLEVQFEEQKSKTSYFTAIFSNDSEEDALFFKLVRGFHLNPGIWEKDSSKTVKFFYNGISHYIIENYDFVGAHWCVGQYEAAIYGRMSIDEAKSMIKSIYER